MNITITGQAGCALARYYAERIRARITSRKLELVDGKAHDAFARAEMAELRATLRSIGDRYERLELVLLIRHYFHRLRVEHGDDVRISTYVARVRAADAREAARQAREREREIEFHAEMEANRARFDRARREKREKDAREGKRQDASSASMTVLKGPEVLPGSAAGKVALAQALARILESQEGLCPDPAVAHFLAADHEGQLEHAANVAAEARFEEQALNALEVAR
jgi:hypothetical protein